MQNFFTKVFIFLLPKHIVPILGTPLKVVQILANAIATANKFHKIFAPGKVSEGIRLWPGASAQK